MIFEVPGRPVPYSRTSRRCSDCGSTKVQSWNPRPYREYREAVGWEALAARPGEDPVDGPVSVEMEASVSGVRIEVRSVQEPQGRWRGTRPDIDNIGKAILDGLQKVVFENDRQVVDLRVRFV